MGFILRVVPALLVKQLIILLKMLFQTALPTLNYVPKCRSFLLMLLLCNTLWGRKVSVETTETRLPLSWDSEFLLSLLHTWVWSDSSFPLVFTTVASCWTSSLMYKTSQRSLAELESAVYFQPHSSSTAVLVYGPADRWWDLSLLKICEVNACGVVNDPEASFDLQKKYSSH